MPSAFLVTLGGAVGAVGGGVSGVVRQPVAYFQTLRVMGLFFFFFGFWFCFCFLACMKLMMDFSLWAKEKAHLAMTVTAHPI